MPDGNCASAVAFDLGFGVGSAFSGTAQFKRAANTAREMANRGFMLAVLTSPLARYKPNPRQLTHSDVRSVDPDRIPVFVS